ncbi:hypothetical protein K437DRAFT_261675 [Tilletiaria anomala UBC 951]|uniref:Uncharacterized protein n=1 Tax=Tilletiaria anomala (strain ATCC 24038 / CBS 436.72 / UBC 951) TaxID=1037660 RepID=A0A066WDZ3_TILAU|nr:uncharacterized protein K437DRAFT_261675 [Tilletiaria anomala UBC 951]KDN51966.1 hypothetical protein K437DRAFT_261675 [Tilletiaria anomala UBC 951]
MVSGSGSGAGAGNVGTIMRRISPYQPTVTTGLLPGVGRSFMNASPIGATSVAAAAGANTSLPAASQAVGTLGRSTLTPPDNLLRRQEAKEKRAKARKKKAAAAAVAAAALSGPVSTAGPSSLAAPGHPLSSASRNLSRSRSSQSIVSDDQAGIASTSTVVRSSRRSRNVSPTRSSAGRSADTRRGSASSGHDLAAGDGRSDSSRPLSRADSRGSSHYVADAEAVEGEVDEVMDAEQAGDRTLVAAAQGRRPNQQDGGGRGGGGDAEESTARAQQASLRRRNLWEDIDGMELPDPDDLPPPFPAGSTGPPSPSRQEGAGSGALAATSPPLLPPRPEHSQPVPNSPPPEFHSDFESDEALNSSRAQIAGWQGPSLQSDSGGGNNNNNDTPHSPAPRVLPEHDADGEDALEEEAGRQSDGSEASFLLMSPERQAWEQDRRSGLSIAERLEREMHRQSQRDSMLLFHLASHASTGSSTMWDADTGIGEGAAGAEVSHTIASPSFSTFSNASGAASDAPSHASVLLGGPPLSADSQNSFPSTVTGVTPDTANSHTSSFSAEAQQQHLQNVIEGIVYRTPIRVDIPQIAIEEHFTPPHAASGAGEHTDADADAGQPVSAVESLASTGTVTARTFDAASSDAFSPSLLSISTFATSSTLPAAVTSSTGVSGGAQATPSPDVEVDANMGASTSASTITLFIGPGQGPDTSQDDSERDRYRSDDPPINTQAGAVVPAPALAPAPASLPATWPAFSLLPSREPPTHFEHQKQNKASTGHELSKDGCIHVLHSEARLDSNRPTASTSGPSGGHRRAQSSKHPSALTGQVQPTRIRERPRSVSETKFRDDATAAAERRSKLWCGRQPLRVVPPPFKAKQPIILTDGPGDSSHDEQQGDEDEVDSGSESEGSMRMEHDKVAKDGIEVEGLESSSDSEADQESDSSEEVWKAEMKAVEVMNNSHATAMQPTDSSSSDSNQPRYRCQGHAQHGSVQLPDLNHEVPRAPPPLVLGRSRGGAAYSSSSDSSSIDDIQSDSSISVAGAHEISSRSGPPPADPLEPAEKPRPETHGLLPIVLPTSHSRLNHLSLESAMLPRAPPVAGARVEIPEDPCAPPPPPPRCIDKGKKRDIGVDRIVPISIKHAAEALQLAGNELNHPSRAGQFEATGSDSSCDFSAVEESVTRKGKGKSPQQLPVLQVQPLPAPSTNQTSISDRLSALFAPNATAAVPLGPSALALSRASADARANFLQRIRPTRWQTWTPHAPITPQPPLGLGHAATATQVTSPFPEISARNEVLEGIAKTRAAHAESYVPSTAYSAGDSLSSLERMLTAASGSGLAPTASRAGSTEEKYEDEVVKEKVDDRRLPHSNPVSSSAGRPVPFLNHRSVVAPLPKEGRLPKVTEATRHFPPTSPTPSWLVYIVPEERRSLQDPIEPDHVLNHKESNRRVGAVLFPGQAGSRVSAMVSKWEQNLGGMHQQQAVASANPLVSPRTDALQRLVGQQGPTVAQPVSPGPPSATLTDRLAPSPAQGSFRFSGTSTIDAIIEGYNGSRSSISSDPSALSPLMEQASSPSYLAPPSLALPPSASTSSEDPDSADRRNFTAVINAGQAANDARVVDLDVASDSAGALPSSVLNRATLVAVPDREHHEQDYGDGQSARMRLDVQ